MSWISLLDDYQCQVLSSKRTKNNEDKIINKVSTGTEEKITLKKHESKK